MAAVVADERMHRHRGMVGALRISAPEVGGVFGCGVVLGKLERESEMGVTKSPLSGSSHVPFVVAVVGELSFPLSFLLWPVGSTFQLSRPSPL